MALPLAKITIIIGAGVLGSVLAKEGSNLSASDLFSGAFKIAWKQLKRDDSPPSSNKPRNDALIAQVKELQKQLKDLVHNQPLTVYNGNRRSGIKLFGGPVIGIAVVGVGYLWWKGWKLSDFMFATTRGLKDACSSVGKQLDQVYSNVTDTKRHLSLRIDRVDANLDECAEITANTKDDVLELRGDVLGFSKDVESVHRAVQTLETKIGRIEEKQDYTSKGVRVLVEVVHALETKKTTPPPSIKASTTTTRTISLPPKVMSLEQPPPPPPLSPSESPRRVLHSSVSASGLKVLSDTDKTEVGLNETTPSPAKIERASSSSSASRFGWKFPGLDSSFLTRTYSATMSFK